VKKRATKSKPTGTVESPYMDTRQTLAFLGLRSYNALYRLINEHGMPICRLGRNYRFDRREIEAWMRGHTSALERQRAERHM
jgi:excisionase family DNA binding protein